jgi:hypothetical protein
MPAATLTRPAQTATRRHLGTAAAVRTGRPAPQVDRRSDSGWTLGDVDVVVHGTTARIRYTTNAPLVEVLVSSHHPHLVDGTWIEPIQACTAGVEFGGGRGTVDVYDHHLQPGLTYHYVLTVPTTVDQRPVQVVGSFVAASRVAEAVAELAAV